MDALMSGGLDVLTGMARASESGGLAAFVAFLENAGVTPDALTETIRAASASFAQATMGLALYLLAATMTIRLVAGTIKELLDGDLIDLIGVYLSAAIMGMILLAILNNWSSESGGVTVFGIVNDMYLGLVRAVSGGGSADSVFGAIFAEGWKLLHLIWEIVGRTWERFAEERQNVDRSVLETAGDVLSGQAFIQGMTSFLTAILLFAVNFTLAVIASILVILLIVSLLFHAITGLLIVYVALAFGPLALSAYPLIDTWAKKLLGTVVGGIAQMLAALLLLSIMTEVLEKAASAARVISGI